MPAIGNGLDSFPGNDFSIDTAGGPFSADALITGALMPTGDEDVFAISNTGTDPVEVYFETFNGGFGACTGGLDTQIRIRDASGAVLAFSDDANSEPLLHVPALRDSGRVRPCTRTSSTSATTRPPPGIRCTSAFRRPRI